MIARSVLILFFIGLVVSSTWNFESLARAQQQSTPNAAASDEQRLIQKIKEAIMKELREGDFLSQQIEIGIQKYVKKQQEA